MGDIDYPQGWDWIWTATDADGFAAAFVTGGQAPIPRDALEIQFRDSTQIEEAVAALPASSDVRVFEEPGDRDTLVELARRGLFVYDWRDARRALRDELGAYELVAAPTSPSRATTLPPVLRVAAMSMRFAGLRFSETPLVDVQRHARCIAPRRLARGRATHASEAETESLSLFG